MDIERDGQTIKGLVHAGRNGYIWTMERTDDGTINFTPNFGFIGVDRFRYTVRDNLGATSNQGFVTVTVSAKSAPLEAVARDLRGRATSGASGAHLRRPPPV